VVHLGNPPAGLALLAVVVLCAGCGSSDASKVSSAKYVKAVCSAISPLETDVVARTQALTQPAANPVEAKKTLQGFLAAVEQDAERAVSRIQAAGTPDITNGKSVANEIVRTFSQLRDAMRAATSKANALPTDSTTAYKTAAQALNANVKASLTSIDPSGLSNPDIEKAAAKEPACKSLSG
jgi:hypothetical protein